ncbi:putative Ig domain-containing protein [Geminocystis sp. CENA526]|uniref:putative Ig domain-containing protein n=1 Tax=Geminocystis sp. CENA526 TaxID=1355871 RepID=UPI003D6E99C5
MTWSFSEKTTFLPSDGGIAFTATDKATILSAMQTAYNGSSTARTMFHNWIDAGKTIEIKFVPRAFQAYLNDGKLELDLSFLENATYITPRGKAVKDTAVTAIVHELVHALTGRMDAGENNPAKERSLRLNGYYIDSGGRETTDYKGSNVDYANVIFAQLGLPQQVSYIAYDSDGSLHKLNFDYTNGATIDRAVSQDLDHSSQKAGNSKDLLIGGPSKNTFYSGDGDDFLWGLGGDDTLNGGNGIDTAGFMGKPTDYDLRLNPDGTWTSRHVRGAKNEGEDKLINIEKVMFEGGQVFNLKKKGLTYQLDFALVIDTTGSMGDSIGAVKANGTAIINTLFADDTKDARIGIVGFKDTTIGEPSSIILPFTDQVEFVDRKAAALNALNGISVSGGGDIPETPFDGLLKALDGTMGDWRPGAGVHRVVLFTDAPAKDASLASIVASYAANIGATITASSHRTGTSGSLDLFTLSPIPLVSTKTERFFQISGDDPDLPPFEFIDESPTPDISMANLEIYTIYTGNFDALDPDLESIANTTGGSFFATPEPDDLVNTLLTIIELPPTNQAPTAVNLSNTTTELAENTEVGAGIKVADITIIDDALGTNELSLTGVDVDSFEIIDTELFYIGESPDFESKNQYQVTVNVQDLSLGDDVFARTDFTLSILDVNEPPTGINLTSMITELAENTEIGTGIKVADITIIDDALGSNQLFLTGADADSFEIIDTELFFIGESPDFESKNQYQVTVNVDDDTVGDTPDATVDFTLTILDVNEAPIINIEIPDQVARATELFNLTIPEDTFIDPDADTLFYSASLEDGTTPLPSWLNFDIETLTFSGTPSSDDVGNLTVGVFANDGSATTFELFTISIEPKNITLNDPLFRFQNIDRPGTYLFVGNEERISVLNEYSPPFVEEGFAFNVSYGEEEGLVRFNRFQNKNVPGTYLFAGEEESVSIRENYSDVFTEEGIAFYALDAQANIGVDYYRFQNTEQPGTYIFVGEAEKTSILNNYPQFQLEGIAFEAFV